MQTITLDYLCSYLTGKSVPVKKVKFVSRAPDQNTIFPLPLHDTVNSSHFPVKFSEILSRNVERYGIIQQDGLTIFYALLFCLDDDFIVLEKSEQINQVKLLKSSLIQDIGEIYKEIGFSKLGWKKKMLLDEMKKRKFSEVTCYLLASYFDINIIIFDFDQEKIRLFYPEEDFNKYKNNMLIAKKGKYLEPLIYRDNHSRLFKYNSISLNNIFNSDILEAVNVSLYKNKEKEVVIEDKILSLIDENIPLDDIIELDLDIETEIESESDHENDETEEFEMVYGKTESKPEYSLSKLERMKKDELIGLAEKYCGHNEEYPKMTKKVIAKMIFSTN